MRVMEYLDVLQLSLHAATISFVFVVFAESVLAKISYIRRRRRPVRQAVTRVYVQDAADAADAIERVTKKAPRCASLCPNNTRFYAYISTLSKQETWQTAGETSGRC